MKTSLALPKSSSAAYSSSGSTMCLPSTFALRCSFLMGSAYCAYPGMDNSASVTSAWV